MVIKIANARIVKTMLGFEKEIGVCTWYLTLETSDFYTTFGGRRIDVIDKKTGGVSGDSLGLTSLLRMLQALDVSTWEELKGQYIQVQLEIDPLGACQLIAVGHFMKDQWFNVSKFYREQSNV